MTKTIVFSEQKKTNTKKPIAFFTKLNLYASDDVSVEPADTCPYEWGYIELICKDYMTNLDLMFAYDRVDGRSSGTLMIGHWNDGLLE